MDGEPQVCLPWFQSHLSQEAGLRLGTARRPAAHSRAMPEQRCSTPGHEKPHVILRGFPVQPFAVQITHFEENDGSELSSAASLSPHY